MEAPPPNQQNDETKNPLNALLLLFDPDREIAGLTYERVRQELIAFFAKHGCVDPEALTDETLTRAASQVVKGTIVKAEPITYVRGIARHVKYRYFKQLSRPFSPPPLPDIEEVERETECLRKCAGLHAEAYEFVSSYVLADEQARLRMAKRLGISIDGLRSRIHRYREELRNCRRKCLKEQEESKII
ncbi:MAG TPA: hypothetical protein VJR02_17995 [Pyrinomonadaceae bacterium]|nr:hypothetical protein [Pyrinomonadaceae bacterium]